MFDSIRIWFLLRDIRKLEAMVKYHRAVYIGASESLDDKLTKLNKLGFTRSPKVDW